MAFNDLLNKLDEMKKNKRQPASGPETQRLVNLQNEVSKKLGVQLQGVPKSEDEIIQKASTVIQERNPSSIKEALPSFSLPTPTTNSVAGLSGNIREQIPSPIPTPTQQPTPQKEYIYSPSSLISLDKDTRDKLKFAAQQQDLTARLQPTTPSNLPNNVSPEWAERNPALTKILNTVTQPMRFITETPFVERAGQTGAEFMTTAPVEDKATTGNVAGDVGADILGAVMGFTRNPVGVAGRLMEAADLGMQLPKVASRVPQVASKLTPAAERLAERFPQAGQAIRNVPYEVAERGIRGGTAGAMFGGTMGTVEGESLTDIPVQAAKDAALFAAMDIGLPYVFRALGQAGKAAGVRIKSARAGKGIEPREAEIIQDPINYQAEGYTEWKPGSGIWQKLDPQGRELERVYETVTIDGKPTPKYRIWREEVRSGQRPAETRQEPVQQPRQEPIQQEPVAETKAEPEEVFGLPEGRRAQRIAEIEGRQAQQGVKTPEVIEQPKVSETKRQADVQRLDEALKRMEKKGYQDHEGYRSLKAKRDAIASGADYTVRDVSEEVIGDVGGQLANISKATIKGPKTKPQINTKQPTTEIDAGSTVETPQGMKLTVVDASDPSMLRVRNQKGTEFSIGRMAVRPVSGVVGKEAQEKPQVKEQPKSEIPPEENLKEYGLQRPKESPAKGEKGAPSGETPKKAEKGAEKVKPETQPKPEPIDHYTKVRTFVKKMADGDYTAQEVKDQYKYLTENKEAVIKALYDKINSMEAHKRKRKNTKQQLAENLYDQALDGLAYSAGDSITYNPMIEGGKEAAIKKAVEKLTDKDIKAYQDKKKAEKEAEKKILENPETLQELRRKKAKIGELTEAEQTRLDELEAKDKKERKQEEKAKVKSFTDVEFKEPRETTHGKTGEKIWVVQLTERVDKETFKELNSAIKKLGGYYSKYPKTRGFIFKEEPTKALEALKTGDASEVVGNKQESKAKGTAKKLREVADNMQRGINKKRADRLTNTARRARMAASAEAEADYMERIQSIMRRIADAIEKGEATHLDGIKARTHVETLERILKQQVFENDRGKPHEQKYTRSGTPIKREPTLEDINSVEYPKPTVNLNHLKDLVKHTGGIKGVGRSRMNVDKVIRQQASGEYVVDVSRVYEDVKSLLSLAKNKGKEQAKSAVKYVNENLEKNKRLEAMGIETDEQLRAALREYMKYRKGTGISEAEKKEREMKHKEQEVSRQKIEGFFPTPKLIVDRMLEEAGIEEGMKVLEPSAGKGNIADQIKENHSEADLDVVEWNNSLRELLEDKGYNLVGDDFLKHSGEYDRIIMNPPFEKGADIEHVRHAYDLLKPDGRVVAIMSEGPFFRSDKQATEFRDWLESVGGVSEQLPEGSFKFAERPTGVKTRLVTIDKPGEVKAKTKEEPKPLHLQTKAKATAEAQAEVNRRKNLPENDMAITSGITRKKMSDKQRNRFQNQLSKNSVLSALDDLKVAEEQHKDVIRAALRDGTLPETEYKRLHEKDYGPAEGLKAPTTKEKAAKQKELQQKVEAKIKDNIENMVPGGKVRHGVFDQVGEVVKVNNKSFRVKVEETGKLETWPKNLIRVAQLPEVKPAPKPEATGKAVTAKTERGTSIEAEYAIVNADKLTASHDTNLRQNENYPQELQPRNRTRVASEDQINRIIANLEPEFLAESAKASEGAPIVGGDMVVESGNARIIALQKAYKNSHGNSAKYKQWLTNNAERFGLNKQAIEKAENPVLVRVRKSDVDRVKFTQEANEQSVAAMSATEQAEIDAQNMSGHLLDMFVPNDTGSILTAGNQDFVRRFMGEVVNPADRGRYMTSDGVLSQEGVTRVKNALFAKAYGDTRAIEILSESTDNNVRNITNSMLMVAPRYARMRDMIDSGDLYPKDIASDIVDAMNKLSDLRNAGKTVEEYLGQGNLFGEDMSPLAKDILDILNRNKRSAKKITAILQNYADAVESLGDPKQGALFEVQQPTKAELFEVAVRKVVRESEATPSLFQDTPVRGETGRKGNVEKGTKEGQSKTRQVEEKLNKEIVDEVGDISQGGFIRLDKFGVKGKESKEPGFEFKDSETEARWQAAKGVPKIPVKQKISEGIVRLKNIATREFEHLPRTGEFSKLRYELSRLQKQKDITRDRTLRNLQAITLKMSPKEYDLFTRKVVLDDLAGDAMEGRKLPFGFTKDTVTAELERVNSMLKQSEQVNGAVKNRKELWNAIKEDYIKAMSDIGFNADKRFNRENYFRHQVLEYVNVKRATSGSGKKLRTPTGRGFLKKREGSELDINSDYLQAEYEVMAQMLLDIEIAKTIKLVDDNYNIAAKLKDKAKKMTKDDPGADIDWQDLIPEGYTTWQPREGTVFYFTDSVPAGIAEKLYEGAAEELGVKANDLRKVLARGQRYKEFVIKEEIAETLDNLTKANDNNVVSEGAKKIQSTWKVWTLVSPRRWFKYNARNITGDADAAFAGNPSTFKKVPQASKELFEFFTADKMTSNLRDWVEEGGMQTLLQAQELGDVNKLKMFVNLMEKKGTIKELPTKAWQGYWKGARLTTDFREAILRYAAYLDYLEQMGKNKGKPKNFGASIPEEVTALNSSKKRAFKLSNELLGAYDQVGVLGQALRSHIIPFWSWNEVNFRRYKQLILNAARDGKTAEVVGRKLLSGVVLKTPAIAYRVGKLALMASGLWIMLDVWNKTMFPELEKTLSPEERNKPHIVLGQDENGETLYFGRLGAMQDFLDWFGFDAGTVDQLQNILDGKKSVKEVAIEMVKNPANKVIQGVGPLIKNPAEAVFGYQLFPDAFKPRPVRDKAQYVFQSLGLDNEYRAIAGLPSKSYQSSLKDLFVYSTDPERTAYYNTLDNKREFQKKINKYNEGSFSSPKGDALYYFKEALYYKDKETAFKYLQQYIKRGGTGRGMQQSLESKHPLYGLNDKEKMAFVKYLDREQLLELKQAIEHYEKVYGGLAKTVKKANKGEG